MGINEEHPL